MSDIKFKCQECGKEFDPDPDTMLEVHATGECSCCNDDMTDEEIEELVESGDAFTVEEFENMNESELQELGLTPADRDALLRGETVATGGVCICRECQARLMREGGKNGL